MVTHINIPGEIQSVHCTSLNFSLNSVPNEKNEGWKNVKTVVKQSNLFQPASRIKDILLSISKFIKSKRFFSFLP